MYFKIGPIIISHHVSALQNGHANHDEGTPVTPENIEDVINYNGGVTTNLNHIGSFQTNNNGMTYVRLNNGVQNGKFGSTNL